MGDAADNILDGYVDQETGEWTDECLEDLDDDWNDDFVFVYY